MKLKTGRLIGRLIKYLDWFIPDEVKSEHIHADLIRRYRLLICLVTSSAQMWLLGFVFFLLFLRTRYEFGILFLGVIAFYGVLLWYIKHTVAYKTIVIIELVVNSGSMLLLAYLTGGIESPMIIWLLATPMITMLLLGVQASVINMAAVILIIFVVDWLQAHAVLPLPDSPEGMMRRMRVVDYTAVTIFLTIVGGFYESLRRRTQEKLETELAERKRIEVVLKRERESLAEQVDRRTAHLARSNRNLEQLLYAISHDLREPLRSMEYFSNAVSTEYRGQLDERGMDFLDRVTNSARHQRLLLDDVAVLAELQSCLEMPTEAIPSAIIVAAALKEADGKVKETGACLTVSPDLPVLNVNPKWAILAIYNLIENGLLFTREGIPPEIEISAYQGAEGVGIAVEDRGPGVPVAYAEKIFQLFQRAVGREIYGTGAGLAFVRQIAEKHGGQAWVQPRDGGGSEFIITFESV